MLNISGMKSIQQFGIVMLLLASYLAPAMACMVPDVQMNAEERACCRAMKNQCDQMEMPASHGCCQKSHQGAHHDAMDTKAVTYHPIAVATVWLTIAESFDPASIAAGWVEHPADSPPQWPPSFVSVLRI